MKEEVKNALLMRATGYETREITTKDEEGTVKHKHVPPSLAAIKMLAQTEKMEGENKFSLLSREELLKEARKMLKEILNEEGD